MLTWIGTKHLQEVVKTAGIDVRRESVGQFPTAEAPGSKDRDDERQNEAVSRDQDAKLDGGVDSDKPFELPGRP